MIKKGFRLSSQAAKYDYVYRPFEDYNVKGGKERAMKDLKKSGTTGKPETSEKRFVNKLFDKLRIKSQLQDNLEGCVKDYEVRESVM